MAQAWNQVEEWLGADVAVEHGLRLCSSDADFARFPGLDWLNPLAA